MGEIVAVQCQFSGRIGKPLLLQRLHQRGEAGNYMGTRLIRARTTNATRLKLISPSSTLCIDRASICLGHAGLFLKRARCFSRCNMSLPSCVPPNPTAAHRAYFKIPGDYHDNRKDHSGWYCDLHHHQLGGFGPRSAYGKRLPKLTGSIAPSRFNRRKAVPLERIPAALPESSKHKTACR